MKRINWLYVAVAAIVVLVLVASCSASAAPKTGNANEAHKPGKDLHDVYEYTKEVHSYANGNSYYIKVLNEKKVSKEEFHTDQARQDQAHAGVVKQTGELTARANQTDLEVTAVKQVNTRQDATLATHGNRLDGHDNQFANMASVHEALDTRLGGAYQRLDQHSAQIARLERDMDKAHRGNAIALAVAAHQFDTKGDFQTAVSGSTIHGKHAVAVSVGGAITERVFFSAGMSQSGSTAGGVMSTTISW